MSNYASDYIDVAARIAEFRAVYPDGSLQPLNLIEPFRVERISGYNKDGQETTQTFVVYVAAAYRYPDDPRPGVGAAYEVFPGRTNFTRGSELQNAETSAWGRAIVAALTADTKRGVASAEEVRNRKAERGELPRNKDGSISRSRTTDEELAAAGAMTKAEKSEHGRLAKDTTANDRKADRSNGPVEDDPWAGDRQ